MQYPCNAFGLLSKKQYAPKAEIDWFSPIKVQNIYKTTNFFINYFLSRTGVEAANNVKTVKVKQYKIKKCLHKYNIA